MQLDKPHVDVPSAIAIISQEPCPQGKKRELIAELPCRQELGAAEGQGAWPASRQAHLRGRPTPASSVTLLELDSPQGRQKGLLSLSTFPH